MTQLYPFLVNLKCVNFPMLIKIRYYIKKFTINNKIHNIDGKLWIQMCLLKKKHKIV